jgi:hypothetical protein
VSNETLKPSRMVTYYTLFTFIDAIVQGHRYDIFEDAGCFPTVYNVTLAYPLYLIWPLFFSLISAIYGGFAVHYFIRNRRKFPAKLNSNGEMYKDSYLRLMWLCCIDLIFSIPYHIYVLIDNARNRTVDPWISWEVTQFDWYRVDFFRRIIIDLMPLARATIIGVMLSTCTCCFVFFILFGFTDEAIESYKTAYYFCIKPFGVKRPNNDISSPNKFHLRNKWIDKLLGRAPATKPINGITISRPVFTSIHQQRRFTPFEHPKNDTRTSVADTLDWDDDITTDRREVVSIDHRPAISRYDERTAKGRPYTPSLSTINHDDFLSMHTHSPHSLV